MAKVEIIGFRELNRVLDNIPKSITNKAKVAAGRKAARPIVTKARTIIEGTRTKTIDNLDGFEHLRALAKATKVVPYKGNVNVQISTRTPDMPMGKKYWNAFNVGMLFAFGRNREGKGSRKNSTGFMKGFGDWITDAGSQAGNQAMMIYKANLTKEVDKAIKRVVRKYGK
jgi:hypothetical protein